MENFDIAIIGGSFAGMTSALAISSKCPNLKIAIIEKQDIKSIDRQSDGRAYAISSSSLELFEEIGIYDSIIVNSGLIEDIKITDYKSPTILNFVGKEANPQNPRLGRIIENYRIHNALRDRVLSLKNITIFCPNYYTDIDFEGEKSLVKLDNGDIIKSDLLLACDGRFSKLRDLFNINTITKDYHQTALVFNISHQRSHQNIAHEKFLPKGPIAILPMGHTNQSSIVWIVDSKISAPILALDDENFVNQLEKKMEYELGKVKVVSKKFSYPLSLIEAKSFYYKNMLLIGDAAAGVNPIAGQGFNLAISGIMILRELIMDNLEVGSGLQGVPARYNQQFKPVAKKMIIATDLLNSCFENNALALKLARNIGMSLVEKLPKIKNYFIKSAGGK